MSETETPLHRLETVYRRMIERLGTANAPDGALRGVLDGWFYTLEEDVLAEGTIAPDDSARLPGRTNELLEQRLAAVTRSAPMFSAALRGYREPVPIRTLAARHGVPDRFLVQILLQLKAAGLVASTRGSAGGYRLARPPAEVSLGQVMDGGLDLDYKGPQRAARFPCGPPCHKPVWLRCHRGHKPDREPRRGRPPTGACHARSLNAILRNRKLVAPPAGRNMASSAGRGEQ